MNKEQAHSSSGGWGFALGVLVGVVAGAAAATLMAPQSGAQTRDQLAVAARRVQHQANELAEDLRRKASRSEKHAEQPEAEGLSSEGVTVL